MSKPGGVVLAIDPGRSKCGVAVVRKCLEPGSEVLHQSVEDTAAVGDILTALAARFAPDVIIVGNGTSSSQAARLAQDLGIAPVELVDEKHSTRLARQRYFRENPPRGLRKLIPISLQTPPRPCDDYVAVILAERYIL